MGCGAILFPLTVKEVSNHFEQRELTKDNIWRSYSTKKSYKAYLNRWIIPHWGTIRLSEVRTIQATREEQLCENQKSLLGPFQSCLPSRTVRSQSAPFGPPRCKTTNHTKRADAR
jgi:hypothetical protein